MRRISLALALVGAVAVAGCGGATGGSKPGGSAGNQGNPNASYSVVVKGESAFWDASSSTTVMLPTGGVVTGPGGINCGVNGSTLNKACSASFLYGTAVALTATPNGTNTAWMWGGACGLTGACSINVTSDKLVVVRFAANTGSLGAHPNIVDPALHGPEYSKFVSGVSGALICTSCHGANLQGQGLAPSCGLCHTNPQTGTQVGVTSTGLVATIDSINVTSPVTVKFHLADSSGNPVDLAGVYSNNLPLSNCGHGNTVAAGCSNTTLGFSVAYFQTVSNGYPTPANVATPYTVLTVSNGSPTMLSPIALNDTGNLNNGIVTADAAAGNGHYVYTFPASVAVSAAKSLAAGYTHEVLMYATRQENTFEPCMATTVYSTKGPFLSCPATADTAKSYSASNAHQAFDAASPGSFLGAMQRREIISSSACDKCHDGFKPKRTGTVSAMFHNGNRVEGWICNVCHNPGRTSNPWANSSQHVHRIHAYAQTEMPAYACVDQKTTNFDVVGLSTLGVPSYAGNGTSVSLPTSATDVSFCNTTTLASLWSNPATAKVAVKAVAFDSTGLDLTFPQDVRNCQECHDRAAADAGTGGAQWAQYKTNASPMACNSCHGGTTTSSGTTYGFKYWYGTSSLSGILDELANELPAWYLPGAVVGDAANNLDMAHPKLAAAAPSVEDCLATNFVAGCNNYTNTGYVAAAGQVPVGAHTWAYSVSNVTLDGSGHPQITFQILKDGAAVPFDACNALSTSAPTVAQTDQNVLFTNTYGAPSVYFVFSVPQDGIAAPADFNGSASGYLASICSEGHTALKGSSAASIAVDGSYNYTVTLKYTTDLSAVKNLTGGVGYTYNPASSPPLTQTGLASFPAKIVSVTDANSASAKVYGVTCTASKPCSAWTGGLVVPARDVWKAASTQRRVIVDTDKCNTCHSALGANPTFHVGQRNDAPSCSFCHTANTGSGGWAANTSTWVHAIHGTDKRTVNYTWEGACVVGSTWTLAAAPQTVSPPTHYYTTGDCIDNTTHLVVAPRDYYPEVTFPGTLRCGECHVDGFFAQTEAAFSNLLWPTYAQGTYSVLPNTSPYVTPGTNYGAAFSYNASTGATTVAATTTLVGSPITAACFSCHDDTATVTHMTGNGGHVYEARSTAMASGNTETCLACHGTGKALDVATVHQ